MTMISDIEQLLATIPGVNVQLPPTLQPPFAARPIVGVRAYENFNRNTTIDPAIGYQCPDGHRALINLLAIAVNYNDKIDTWTDPLYHLRSYRNDERYPLLNPHGTLPVVGTFSAQSDNLIILANEASNPTAGAGAVVSGLNDNPLGLTNMWEVKIVLDENDEWKLVYDGSGGTSDTGHYLYLAIKGWYWLRQAEPEGSIGL